MRQPGSILYSFRRCPYAIRARMAMVLSGYQVSLREVNLRQKPAEMLAVSPKGTVPVLVTADGAVIDESQLIVSHVLAQQNALRMRQSVGPQVAMFQDWMLALEAVLPAITVCKYPDRGGDATMSRQLVMDFLQRCEDVLQAQDFLLGASLGECDCLVLPHIRQFYKIDVDDFMALPYLAVQRWLLDCLSADWFARVMLKQPVWQPDAEPTWLL